MASIEDPFCKLEKENQIWNKFKPKKKGRAEDDVDWLAAMSMVGEYDSGQKVKKTNRPDAATMDFLLESTLGDTCSFYEDELNKAGCAALKRRRRTRPSVMLFQRHRLPLFRRLLQRPNRTLPLHRGPITTDMLRNCVALYDGANDSRSSRGQARLQHRSSLRCMSKLQLRSASANRGSLTASARSMCSARNIRRRISCFTRSMATCRIVLFTFN